MKRQATILPRSSTPMRCPTCHYWPSSGHAECWRCAGQSHAPFRLETLPARLTVPLPDCLDVATKLVLWAFMAALCVGIFWVIAITLAGAR